MGFGPHFLGWTSKDHFFLIQTWNIENRLDWEHILIYNLDVIFHRERNLGHCSKSNIKIMIYLSILGSNLLSFFPPFFRLKKKGYQQTWSCWIPQSRWKFALRLPPGWRTKTLSAFLHLVNHFRIFFVTMKYRQCPWNAFWKTSRHALLYKLVGFYIIVFISLTLPFVSEVYICHGL